MPTFKDANGKEWVVKLDGPKIGEVRKKLGLDLAATDGTAADKLYNDLVLLVDTLWIVCRSQAVEAGIKDTQFGEALVGDPIDPATEALIEAINDFFPKSRREALQTLTAQMRETRTAGLKDAMTLLTDPKLQTRIQTAMRMRAEAEINSLLTQLSDVSNTPEQ